MKSICFSLSLFALATLSSGCFSSAQLEAMQYCSGKDYNTVMCEQAQKKVKEEKDYEAWQERVREESRRANECRLSGGTWQPGYESTSGITGWVPGSCLASSYATSTQPSSPKEAPRYDSAGLDLILEERARQRKARWIAQWQHDRRSGPSDDQERLVHQYPEVGWLRGYWCAEGASTPDHKYHMLADGGVLHTSSWSSYGITYYFEPVGAAYYDVWDIDISTSSPTEVDKAKVHLSRYERRSDNAYALVYTTDEDFTMGLLTLRLYPDLDLHPSAREAQEAVLKELVRSKINLPPSPKRIYLRCE